MPLAGYAASRGNVGLVTVIIAGTLGSLAGTSAWYYAGHMLGPVRLRLFAETYGRWLTMTPADIDRAAAWFERSGTWAVLVGRLVPGVRTVVSLPAGIAGMPIGRFLSYSAAGTVVWTAALAISGYVMGQNYARVGGFVEPVSNAMLIVAAVIYLYRVATFGRKNAGR